MPRRVPFPILATVLAACLGPAEDGNQGEHPAVAARPLPADAPPAVLGVIQLSAPGERWFGGLSGMVLDGDVVTAVTDAGHWLRFTLEVGPDGAPIAATALQVAPLGGLDGSRDDGDAEEVVATADGLVVAFERRHRLLLYRAGLAGTPLRLETPPGLDRQPGNGGAEAMAPLADGRLLVIAEEGGDGVSPAWIGGADGWERLGLRRRDGFSPTAAAALPGGDVLVLERRFSLLGGIGARLVRLAVADLRPGAIVEGRELARFGPPLPVDNYEGLAVRRRGDGALVAYLLSDDNFSPLQATLLMAVQLP